MLLKLPLAFIDSEIQVVNFRQVYVAIYTPLGLIDTNFY